MNHGSITGSLTIFAILYALHLYANDSKNCKNINHYQINKLLFLFQGVELKLKNVQAVGVYGWSSVCETIFGEWLEDISQNQVL